MAIDYTSDVGKTRLLIGDTNEDSLIFSDEQIQCFLNLNGGNIYLSAIMGLETWASQTCTSSGDDYRIGDLEFTEGRSKANQILALINERKSAIANGLNTGMLGIGIFTGIYTSDIKNNFDRVIDGELEPSEVYKDTYDIYNCDIQNGPYN